MPRNITDKAKYWKTVSSIAQSCPTLCDPMNRSTPGLPVHHQLLEFTQTYVHQVGDAIQPSHPLSSPSPPAPNTCQLQGFSNESTLCIRWPKFWSFSFSISPSNEHPGLISFRMDWLNLLAVQAAAVTDSAEARLRGTTPRPKSGAVTKSARLRWRRSGGEELPHVPRYWKTKIANLESSKNKTI